MVAASLPGEHLDGGWGLRGPPKRLGSDPGEGASFSLSCGVEGSQEGREAWASTRMSAGLLGKLERRRKRRVRMRGLVGWG